MSNLPSLCIDFLHVDNQISPELFGLCAGFEYGKWQHEKLGKELVHWIEDFVLNSNDYNDIAEMSILQRIATASLSLYTKPDPKGRGDIGELLLHAVLRKHFNVESVVSKYYYKDSSNQQVLGYDGVHISIDEEEKITMWLGESKYHDKFGTAISDICSSIESHTSKEYLKREFMFIQRKISKNHKNYEVLKKLFQTSQQSLDKVIDKLCIPLFLACGESNLKNHNSSTQQYQDEFRELVNKRYNTLVKKLPQIPIGVVVIILPLLDRNNLTSSFDKSLKSLQDLVV